MRVLNNALYLIEMHLMEREWVGVFVCLFVIDESAVFAVFHQIADTYDQARGWVILSR